MLPIQLTLPLFATIFFCWIHYRALCRLYFRNRPVTSNAIDTMKRMSRLLAERSQLSALLPLSRGKSCAHQQRAVLAI